jgi:hypothetical protein
MDEQDFTGRELFRVIDQGFSRSVRTELELFHLAAHTLRRLIRIERDFIVWLGAAQNPGGR